MTRIAALIAAVLLLTSCSYLGMGSQALPWKTLDELKADIVSDEPAMCSGSVSAPGMMFKVAATHDGVNYLIFVAPVPEGETTEQIVAAQLDKAGHPVRIYRGVFDESTKTIKTLESHPFDDGKDQGPCQVLFPA